jgi:hypothetical protein
MSNWPENELDAAVRIQQGRDFIDEDAEQARLEAMAQVRDLRIENLSYKSEARKAAKLRKALALTPIVLAVGLAALPNFKKESTQERMIEEAYAVIFGLMPVGIAEGTRRGRIKRSKDMAKDAHQINLKIGRSQDRWIIEDLGLPPESEI